MIGPAEKAALNYWYCLGLASAVPTEPSRNRLLGHDLALHRGADDAIVVETTGKALPVRERFGMLWTTLGAPSRDIVDIPEADEPDRRFVPCGAVTVVTSTVRVPVTRK